MNILGSKKIITLCLRLHILRNYHFVSIFTKLTKAKRVPQSHANRKFGDKSSLDDWIDKSKIYDEVKKNRTWKDWGWELQLPQVLIKLATNGFFWARHQNLTANRSMLKDLIVCFFNNLHLHFEYDYINLGKSDFFVIFQESPN